ncbi:dihydropteroate synthase [Aureimonas flava]|uniref:Dihydropteroate synthase n=1 Tax=Aureimonas flava TaxID=2320271 RepID=A0A3A1WNY2_9HYPH|nr:dihydropteroate synthase [Aureimonas flava]RIY03597.1 dihydropteroate synthase [Aureimonas flava]
MNVERIWRLGHRRELRLGPRAVIMGVLNVTPDSFSDGGLYDGSVARAVEAALAMVSEGASIVDVGGESTRPGAEPVDAAEEQRRVLPVIRALRARCEVAISIDTYRAETAALAVEAGASIVNDVWGAQKDRRIAEVAARTGAGLCLMHTGREREKLPDVIEDQRAFLGRSIEIARAAGVADESIVIDPGFGFAKAPEENLELMMRVGELADLGFPILAGTSRKRFVRGVLDRDTGDADVATAATGVLLRERGVSILRVHAVAPTRDALAVVDAALAGRQA